MKGSIIPLAAVSFVAFFSTAAHAVCAGYNYAYYDGGSTGTYVISDCTPQCNVVRVDNLGGSNVCTTGNYRCSAPPIRVTDIRVNGLWYACRNDANKGQCNGRPGAQAVPTSCCRNDGRRNLKEGRITRDEYEAIERRNAELDAELVEFQAKERS
ncbi:hypothetical protein L211DRAFT_851670 [Terfezia boudieri ATCC MYA-4762]|uniref:Uncharacterized protein n=1 Tax=Terfezia boudieri ATCC MYA-4762 TaxID=1051890 RepID=A0A3N4LHJ6_9PEZI|nr:hypothetical protein L211DRAFT_851670 [Terfezia boudieri ATCC MYA-4762]